MRFRKCRKIRGTAQKPTARGCPKCGRNRHKHSSLLSRVRSSLIYVNMLRHLAKGKLPYFKE